MITVLILAASRGSRSGRSVGGLGGAGSRSGGSGRQRRQGVGRLVRGDLGDPAGVALARPRTGWPGTSPTIAQASSAVCSGRRSRPRWRRCAARASRAVSSFQASAARTPGTLLAAICSPLPEPPMTTPEAARVGDHRGRGVQAVRRVVVLRVVAPPRRRRPTSWPAAVSRRTRSLLELEAGVIGYPGIPAWSTVSQAVSLPPRQPRDRPDQERRAEEREEQHRRQHVQASLPAALVAPARPGQASAPGPRIRVMNRSTPSRWR